MTTLQITYHDTITDERRSPSPSHKRHKRVPKLLEHLENNDESASNKLNSSTVAGDDLQRSKECHSSAGKSGGSCESDKPRIPSSFLCSKHDYKNKEKPKTGKRTDIKSDWSYGDQRHSKVNVKTKPHPAEEIPFADLNRFVYGNFHHYYGYRNQDSPDMRLSCMKSEWLTGKDVLDIGCNAGHFTLSVARDFSPRMIIGIDIDHYLINVANKNVRHYVDDETKYFSEIPPSFITHYGPIPLALTPNWGDAQVKFPYNICFVQGNYVLSTDELVETQMECFDTVLCLSLTKWIHLNWGDDGLKRTFHRMYAHLRPGGFMILEAQPYSSYQRKKKISEKVLQNYNSMSFFPEQFNEYLLSEVGFKTCELIDIPAHSSKGFSRPLYLFTKESDKKETSEEASLLLYQRLSRDTVCSDETSSSSSDSSEVEESPLG